MFYNHKNNAQTFNCKCILLYSMWLLLKIISCIMLDPEDSKWINTWIFRGFPVAQCVKNPPVMQETQVRSLGQEDPLEEEMAIHSSILAWRILWTETDGLQSMGSQRLRHDWATKLPPPTQSQRAESSGKGSYLTKQKLLISHVLYIGTRIFT